MPVEVDDDEKTLGTVMIDGEEYYVAFFWGKNGPQAELEDEPGKQP